jgi:hypothetical protein
MMVLDERYRLGSLLAADRWAATDFYTPGREMVAIASGPAGPDADDRVREAKRILSWLRHPGLDLPRDVLIADDTVWQIVGGPRGTALSLLVPTVEDAARYAIELCEILAVLDRHLALPSLDPRELRVTSEGHLLLSGIGVDPSVQVSYPVREEAWAAPPGASSSWYVGRLLLDLLRRVESREPRVGALRAVARRAMAERPWSLYLLRRRLDAILLRPGPDRPRPGVDITGRWIAVVVVAVLMVASLAWSLWMLASDGPRLVAGVFGGRGWVEGKVTARGPLLTSPLGGHPCIAYEAHATRVIERKTYLPRQHGYEIRRSTEELLDRHGAVPFMVGKVRVEPGAIMVAGPAERFDDVGPARPLRPGEHVVAVRGYETCIRAGDEAYVHGDVEGAVLRPGADGPIFAYDGGWRSFALAAAGRALPLLLFVASSGCAVCIGGRALWRKGLPRGARAKTTNPPGGRR